MTSAQGAVAAGAVDGGAGEQLVPRAEAGPLGLDLHGVRRRRGDGRAVELAAGGGHEVGIDQPALGIVAVGAEERGALAQLEGDVQAGGPLQLGGRPPRAEPVDPAVDPHLPAPEDVGGERGPPAVVALGFHGRLGPLAAGRATHSEAST